MNGKKAALLFVVSCLILAILLFTEVLTPNVAGIVFVMVLAVFTVPSNCFRRI